MADLMRFEFAAIGSRKFCSILRVVVLAQETSNRLQNHKVVFTNNSAGWADAWFTQVADAYFEQSFGLIFAQQSVDIGLEL